MSGPAKRADVQRVLDRLQKKDTYNIFKNPVTEEMVRLWLLLGPVSHAYELLCSYSETGQL